MHPSIPRHRRLGPIARAALTGASLLALTLPLLAQTPAAVLPAPPAVPAPAAPNKPDAPRPDAQRADADAAKRAADRAAFFDARVAAVHAGLQLTPTQDALWPPVDTAVHDLAGAMRAARDKRRDAAAPADAVEGLQRLAERSLARGTALKRLSDAVTPLYASLSADQKDRLPMLMHGLGPRMGRDMGRDFGMRSRERPGMERDRRGDDEGGRPSLRGGGRMGEARGERFRDERAEGGERRDWGFQDRGPRQRDDRGGYGRGRDEAD